MSEKTGLQNGVQKNFRYLLVSCGYYQLVLVGFAALIVGLSLLLGLPERNSDGILASSLASYWGAFPFWGLLCLFLFACFYCSYTLNVAISFGARRRDYFWALQGLLVCSALIAWGVQKVMAWIPVQWASWAELEHYWDFLTLKSCPWWMFPLLGLLVQAVGCVCGLVCIRSKLWGIVLIVAASVGLPIVGLLFCFAPQTTRYLILGVGAALIPVCEAVLWRLLRHYCVR